MKITLCGSIAFYDKMLEAKTELEKHGHVIELPPHEIRTDKGTIMPVSMYYELRHSTTEADSWIWEKKRELMLDHFNKIAASDAILVLNYLKNNTPGYIGANTLMEMGLALYLNKKIFLLNDVPRVVHREEILGMQPVILNGDLNGIV